MLALLVLLVSHALILIPTLVPGSQWLGPVVTRFRTDSREVWLTIDDGPDPIETPRILDLLESHGARATFFIKGVLANRHPNLVAEICRRGHSIGNHSQTHPSGTFWCLPPRRIAEEIDRATDSITSAAGTPPRWFRAPVGMKNPFVHPILEPRGMRLIGWSCRGWDTVSRSPAASAERILRDVFPGAILLTHEGPGVHGERTGSRILEILLPRLREEGYDLVIPGEQQFQPGSTNDRTGS